LSTYIPTYSLAQLTSGTTEPARKLRLPVTRWPPVMTKETPP